MFNRSTSLYIFIFPLVAEFRWILENNIKIYIIVWKFERKMCLQNNRWRFDLSVTHYSRFSYFDIWYLVILSPIISQTKPTQRWWFVNCTWECVEASEIERSVPHHCCSQNISIRSTFVNTVIKYPIIATVSCN